MAYTVFCFSYYCKHKIKEAVCARKKAFFLYEQAFLLHTGNSGPSIDPPHP